MSIAASGMGYRPPRMKIRQGCLPRVLWPAAKSVLELTAILARSWMIGFSKRDAAHNHDLLRYLSSQRCMRSWQSYGRPLLRPEATHLPSPSSLPAIAGRPGGTWTFPMWREQLRCTCARKTPPRGGIVCVSHPKPVRWRLTKQAYKVYCAAGQAASTLHAKAIMQVHQAKALTQMHKGICIWFLLQPRFKLLNLARGEWHYFRHTISPSKYCKADVKPPSLISSWCKAALKQFALLKVLYK